jgi:orotate phosphoribosyltransferase
MLIGYCMEVARMILKRGVFLLGLFKVKAHEEDETLPPSPFYFNLRDKNNPKPGPLEEEDYLLIARCIFQVIKEERIIFDALAGLPKSGIPIVNAMKKLSETDGSYSHFKFRIFELSKIEVNGKRKIVPKPRFEYRKGERVLLVDDVVDRARTKLEAIEATESTGAIVVGVAVLIDREQGGLEEIRKIGHKLYAAILVSEFLEYCRHTKFIIEVQFKNSIAYLQNRSV